MSNANVLFLDYPLLFYGNPCLHFDIQKEEMRGTSIKALKNVHFLKIAINLLSR